MLAPVARANQPARDSSSSKDRVLFDNQEETVNWIAVESLSRQSGGLLIDLFLMSLVGRAASIVSRFVHVQIPGSATREHVIRNDNETLIGRRLVSMLRSVAWNIFLFFTQPCHIIAGVSSIRRDFSSNVIKRRWKNSFPACLLSA